MKATALSLGTTARTLLAQLRGVGNTGRDNDAEPMDRSEVVQPAGLMTQPRLTATTEAVVVRRGSEAVVIALLDKGRGPLSPALEEGETRLYNDDGARVRLRGGGDVELDTAGGHLVNLQGGGASQGIARLGDTVDRNGAMGTWMTQVEAALAIITTSFASPTYVQTTVPPVSPCTNAIASIASCSAKARCG